MTTDAGTFLAAIDQEPRRSLVRGVDDIDGIDYAFFDQLVWAGLAVQGFRSNFSLLPVIGILTNLYLMTELGASNWLIFVIWLVIGLVIYFSYGFRHSKLASAGQ